ncbi:hypothetical protein M5K25_014231 [Dendrobium thyrsiflorum]|uniref:Uncharacterized protein n=1 Tax=Dendrobium thyrsiflorum TaxID=117978 RepID=A0ABD0V297_DENTH
MELLNRSSDGMFAQHFGLVGMFWHSLEKKSGAGSVELLDRDGIFDGRLRSASFDEGKDF